MKIFTWNVRYKNKKFFEGLRYIYSQNPDVICLQEFPKSKLNKIIEGTKYYASLTEDFIGNHKKIHKKNDSCILTLTKTKPISKKVITYYQEQKKSLLDFIYKKFSKLEEQHKALQVKILVNGKPMEIINARLSCAVPGIERLRQLNNLLKYANDKTIFVGDFNLAEGFIFKLLTGWVRAYTISDYKTKERDKAEQLFWDYSLDNIFEKIRTSIWPFPKLQQDHILVPKKFQIFEKTKHKKTYLSDHHILSAEVTGIDVTFDQDESYSSL